MAAEPLTLEEFPRTAAVLEEYAVAVRNAYQDRLIRGNKIATGELVNTAETVITTEAGCILVQLSLEDYWKYVEDGVQPAGRRLNPGWSAYPAIREWITVKPILPRPDKNGRLPSLNSLSYLITRKIVNKGIPATNAMAAAVEGQTALWEERISAALAEDFHDVIAVMVRS